MQDLLGLIAGDVRKAIARGHYRTHAALAAPSRAPSLTAALREAPGRFALVAELKPRSPTAGPLLSGDPLGRADLYRLYGAAGISVLTEPDHFGGSLELLARVSALGVPTLAKDFVVEEEQLRAARGAGASAVLLIHHLFSRRLAAMSEEEAIDRAHQLGLEVLLEVDNERDFQAALGTGADVIGVNARDLATMELDPERPIDCIRFYRGDRIVLALSGVERPEDADRYRDAGARGVLVGSALSRAEDPRPLLRGIQGCVHVKVCGVTNEAGLTAARGADAVGFIVRTPSSPRNVPPERAAALARATPSGVERVAVTSEPDPAKAAALAAAVGADTLQWHVEAEPGAASRLREALAGRRLVLTVRIAPEEPDPSAVLAKARELADRCDRLLLDTRKGGSSGGTGTTLDWECAARVVEAVAPRPVVLSGGLSPENVAKAVSTVAPWGVDASSRLESAPGVKDPGLVEAYLLAARRARARAETGPPRLRMV